ncbi:very short patch repair endonuclease [Ramlibacter albus]|uniref:Very short patch repair endonuclease n=1 Tax=Ramlibacter albus TaxID=2079448 RepID=A0A923S0V1_9BURK|nr:DNA mismatch endonuclease Vsr [Ramlibacter albus]MBC5763759.1 DNA mismatch endonuclease Vsr [Ramlibacter albus]
MADVVDAAKRSSMMAGIGPKDTQPELAVRRYLHAAGLRFRVHDRRLPGTPDIILPQHRVAIFVHGCFWHRHPGCRFATTPSSNVEFWQKKFEGNVLRDQIKEDLVRMCGWSPIVVWECETRTPENLESLFWRVLAESNHQTP